MAKQTLKAFVDDLYCDEVNAETRTIDWAEEFGEDCEGWRHYEVSECHECGQQVCNDGYQGETRHCDVDSDTECGGYLNFDGPMMNYFYPCDFSRIGGIREAAKRLQGCCVAVELRDGSTGFALAGGGMDLTWDIAGSYVACGQLPPVDKTRLPRFAGKKMTANTRRIIAACIKSNQVATNWAASNIEDLKHTAKQLRENSKKGKKAA